MEKKWMIRDGDSKKWLIRNNFYKHRSQCNTNFVEYAFIVNVASIRTFEGCNMAMVRGLRNKGYKARNLNNPTHSP